MQKIVKDPIRLPLDEIEEFTRAFRANSYQLIKSEPTEEYAPEYMDRRLLDPATHQRILNDPNAHFELYSMQYTASSGECITAPTGMYGVSKRGKIRFPLLVNGFWQAFLMTDKSRFRQICDIEEDKVCDHYYAIMINLKRKFIESIFAYYYSLDPQSCSAMAWEIRNKSSNTRIVAQSLCYHRNEHNGREIYTSTEVSPDKLDFIKKSILRWGISVENVVWSDDQEINPKTRFFVRSMVGYTVETAFAEIKRP